MTENKETQLKTTPAAATVEVKADKKPAEVKAPEKRTFPPRGNGPRGPRGKGRGNNRRFQRPPQEFEEKVVSLSRVTTVVKGGRRFSFSCVVVIGNKKGKVGYGHGKANEVPDSIKKAIADAKRNLINVPIIDGRTIPHEIQGKYISSNILLKPAPTGKGIIASGSVRAVVELAGYKDIVTKSLGSSNKTNVVKATLKALESLRTIEEVARIRNLKVSDIL